MQTSRKGARRSQAGLTLIELLVAMIIMSVISTMLVGAWISLQRSYAYASAASQARATARDAIDRVSSEVRAAQPPTLVASTPMPTPFYFAGASPYICDAYHCVFYSAYNNSAAADGTGMTRQRLTAIWLDTSGGEQKTLKWTRDTYPSPNGDGQLTSNDRTLVLARNVVNYSLSPKKPIFIYYFRDPTTGVYTNSENSTPVTLLTSASAANLVSVQIELVVDANLAHTPSYADVITTVWPRNAAIVDSEGAL
jgi:prepilin-type N-terminal cleavage/methylation domain-containing protein